MAHRFFVESATVGDLATLCGGQAHHLLHVMRAVVGTQVVLFDGSGHEFRACMERIGRSTVDLRVLSSRHVSRELPCPLILGVAPPKGDRQKWLVEKAVELGVTRLILLQTKRALYRPSEKTFSRLRRTVVEASKQCGRNRLMEVAEAVAWQDYVGQPTAATEHPPPCLLMAHLKVEPDGPSEDVISRCASAGHIRLAIGPEGGLTENEVAVARHQGWRTVTLGPRILRIETAAVALVSLVAHGAMGQRPRPG